MSDYWSFVITTAIVVFGFGLSVFGIILLKVLPRMKSAAKNALTYRLLYTTGWILLLIFFGADVYESAEGARRPVSISISTNTLLLSLALMAAPIGLYWISYIPWHKGFGVTIDALKLKESDEVELTERDIQRQKKDDEQMEMLGNLLNVATDGKLEELARQLDPDAFPKEPEVEEEQEEVDPLTKLREQLGNRGRADFKIDYILENGYQFDWDRIEQMKSHELSSFVTGIYHRIRAGVIKQEERPPEGINLPDKLRFGHQLVLAASGHGKSYFLKSAILEDLKNGYSVVAIDSQSTLFEYDQRSGEPGLIDLVPEERIVYLDPTDPSYYLALNLFDGMKLEALEYIFSAQGRALSGKQRMVYLALCALLRRVPGATIHDLFEALEDGGLEKYEGHFDKYLGERSARRFLENDYPTREYIETRAQIKSRLYGVTSNDTMAGMFAAPTTKIDLPTEINAGKLILINTARGGANGLDDESFSLFGRFWIAQVRTAMESQRLKQKTLLYIDEAHEYFADEAQISGLFRQARKFNVGVAIATQDFAEFSPKLQRTVLNNTAIQLAGALAPDDATRLAKSMNVEDPMSLRNMPKFKFEAFFRDDKLPNRRVQAAKLPNVSYDEDRYMRLKERMKKEFGVPREQKKSQREPELVKEPDAVEARPSTRYSSLDFLDED